MSQRLTRSLVLAMGLGLFSIAEVQARQTERAARSGDTPAAQSQPVIDISPETTFVTEPLNDRGKLDYMAFINQHFSRGVTPENNAAVLLYQALGPKPEGVDLSNQFFQLLGMPRPAETGPYLKGLGKVHPRLSGVEAQQLYQDLDQAMTRPWQRNEMPRIAEWLEQNSTPLDLVYAAVERTQYYSPWTSGDLENDQQSGGLIAVLLPGVQLTREMARLLACRAMLRLGEGDPTGAWNDLIVTRKLGRLVGRGPSLIEGLVGIAIEGIAIRSQASLVQNARLDVETWADFADQLHLLPEPMPLTTRVNYGERVMYLDTTQNLAHNQDAVVGLLADNHAALLNMMAKLAIDWNVVMQMGNRYFDQAVAALSLPDYHERVAAMKQIEEQLNQWRKERWTENEYLYMVGMVFSGRKVVSEQMGNILCGLMMPAFRQVQNAEDRAVQLHRNLQTALALRRYWQENGRQYPETLDQLVPFYLSEVPTDLFAARPLTYRRDGDGFVLYSIGRDEIDQDGLDRQRGGDGDDLVIRFER